MKRFSNILYIVGSGLNESTAFGRAVKLANANQAKLTVAGVIEDIDKLNARMPTENNLVDNLIIERREKIQQLVNSISTSNLNVEIKIFTGKAFIDIIQEVLEFNRDLLIKAIEHSGTLVETIFGSTDIKLLRKCPCPVWLIKAKAQEGYKQILVGLDYEPENPENEMLNIQLLSMASSLALAEFSELHVVHAWYFEHEELLRSTRLQNTDAEVDQMIHKEEDDRRAWLSGIVDKSLLTIDMEISSYLKPQLHLIKGGAGYVVPELAKQLSSELVVMGTVGRTGISGYIIGNTAETILHQINCSVLAIKPKGFVSPIKLEQ